nr:YhjD/YihY/BrkB family envelope integrity protein [Methyloceanibacter stevinii]
MDVLWRIYNQLQNDRLLAVAAGVVFYMLLALFPALTALVSLYGLVSDPAEINAQLSLLAGVVPNAPSKSCGTKSRASRRRGPGRSVLVS